MAIIGPGASKQVDVAPDPTLKGFSEYEYAEILNPLTDDFMVQVAQDVPVNMPFELHSKTLGVQSEQDVRSQYGLGLKNPDHKSKKYIFNNTVIPAGQTVRFKGDVAQVVVTQLTNEILQRQGKRSRRLISDPVTRQKIEQDIIISRGSVQELLDGNFRSASQQINDALNKSNEVYNEEFPDLNTTGSQEAGLREPDSGGAQLGGTKEASSSEVAARETDSVPADRSRRTSK